MQLNRPGTVRIVELNLGINTCISMFASKWICSLSEWVTCSCNNVAARLRFLKNLIFLRMQHKGGLHYCSNMNDCRSEDSLILWMLNNICCIPEEKTPENILTLFIFHKCKFWNEEKKTKFTANAALKKYSLWLRWTENVHFQFYFFYNFRFK